MFKCNPAFYSYAKVRHAELLANPNCRLVVANPSNTCSLVQLMKDAKCEVRLMVPNHTIHNAVSLIVNNWPRTRQKIANMIANHKDHVANIIKGKTPTNNLCKLIVAPGYWYREVSPDEVTRGLASAHKTIGTILTQLDYINSHKLLLYRLSELGINNNMITTIPYINQHEVWYKMTPTGYHEHIFNTIMFITNDQLTMDICNYLTHNQRVKGGLVIDDMGYTRKWDTNELKLIGVDTTTMMINGEPLDDKKHADMLSQCPISSPLLRTTEFRRECMTLALSPKTSYATVAKIAASLGIPSKEYGKKMTKRTMLDYIKIAAMWVTGVDDAKAKDDDDAKATT